MNIPKRIEKFLNRNARPFILVQDGVGTDIKAVLQPMRYKNKMYLDSQYTKLGIVDESSFLMLAPAGLDINEHYDFLVDDANQYSFVKVEQIYCLDTPAYTWAILRLRSW